MSEMNVSGNKRTASAQKAQSAKKVVQKKKKTIAQALHDFADNNTAAVGKQGFTDLLKKINKNTVISVIQNYDNLYNTGNESDSESIVETILDETGSKESATREALIGEGDGKTSVRGIFTILLDKAKEAGVDKNSIAKYKADFIKELDKELKGSRFMRSSAKMDEIIQVVIQSIENQKALTPKQKKYVAAAPSTMQATTIKIISDRYNNAVRNFNAQLKHDGWAADVADGLSSIWGSKNRATKVRKDLKTAQAQIRELKEASKKGKAAFEAKFKEIFGISYNAQNVAAYEQFEKTYISASIQKGIEDKFKSDFKLLLNNDVLKEEGENRYNPGTDEYEYKTTATKQQVYTREFNKLAKYVKGGKEALNKKIAESGAKTLSDKYQVLKQIANGISSELHSLTAKACGGRSFSAVEKSYQNSYKAAFGLNNNILKRVTDYNISQEKGAGIVKGAVVAIATIAVGLTTGGSGLAGVAAIAGTAGAASAAAEVSDRATSGKAIDAAKKSGLKGLLKAVNEDVDWSQLAKTSLVNGAMAIAFMGTTYAVSGLTKVAASSLGMSATATAKATVATTTLAGVAFPVGTEYALTGKITVEGVAFAVVLAVVNGAVQLVKISQLAASAKAAQAETESMIQNARKTLGIPDDAELTPEVAKQYRNAKAKALHSDRSAINGASNDLEMALVNDAYKTLTNALKSGTVAAAKPTAPTTEPAAAQTAQDSNLPVKIESKIPVKVTTGTKDFATKLADFKGADGKQFLSSEEIANLLKNQTGLGGEPIENFQARVEAVLSNPEEIASISGWKSRGAGVWRAIQDPLNSTVEANPQAFGVKPKTTTTPALTDFATKLADFKGADGKQFLSSEEIANLLKNQTGLGGEPIENFQARVEAVLSNPEEIASISGWKSRGAGVWRAIQDPLNSTVEANPELFGTQTTGDTALPAQIEGRTHAKQSSAETQIKSPEYQTLSDEITNCTNLDDLRKVIMPKMQKMTGQERIDIGFEYNKKFIELRDDLPQAAKDIHDSFLGRIFNRGNSGNSNSSARAISHSDFVRTNNKLFNGVRDYGFWQQYSSRSSLHSPWKMHLYSVSESDWQKMCQVVIPILKKYDVTWKTLGVTTEFSELNGGIQEGKAFTVYPKNNQEMEMIAKALDKAIREAGLVAEDSHIVGDRQMGNSGRLFYRYEFNSGRYQNEILDLNNGADKYRYRHVLYDANRGEGQYLAKDMTPADDIWLNFDPSNPNSKPGAAPAPRAAEINTPRAQRHEFVSMKKPLLAERGLEEGQMLPQHQEVVMKLDDVVLLGGEYTLKLREFSHLKDGQSITVGREGDYRIPGDNMHVSPNHLEITRRGDDLIVIDNSKNGTRFVSWDIQENETAIKETAFNDALDEPDKIIVDKPQNGDADKSAAKINANEGAVIDGSSIKGDFPKDTKVKCESGTVLLLGAEGQEFPLALEVLDLQEGQTYTVGRLGEIKIPGNYMSVSRQHLEITKQGDSFIVVDKSKYGTRIEVNSAEGVWRAIQDPLNSTVEANPELFGAEPSSPEYTALANEIANCNDGAKLRSDILPKIKELQNTSTEEANALFKLYNEKQAQLKSQLTKSTQKAQFNVSPDMPITEAPKVENITPKDKLMLMKNPNGSPKFNYSEIEYLSTTLEKYPEQVLELANMFYYAKPIKQLAPILHDYPEQVRELYSMTLVETYAKSKVEYRRFDDDAIEALAPMLKLYPEQVRELCDMKGPDGKPKFINAVSIKYLAPVLREYPEQVRELVSMINPDGSLKFDSYEIENLAPVFAAYPEQVKMLSNIKYENNNRLFSVEDIKNIIYNCKNVIDADPQSFSNAIEKLSKEMQEGHVENPAFRIWKILYY